MKTYELTYLIAGDISGETAKEIQGKVASFIQEEGGVLLEENSLLKRKLAYPIKKSTLPTQQSQAYLAFLNFQIQPENLTNLEKKLKAEGQILRYLILVKKKVKAIPEAVKISPKKVPVGKEKKVELKEIEKKLEEILSDELK